jgi:phosphatidylserine synthase
MIPFARIAIWGLSLGAALLIVLILGHSGSNEDVNSKVFAAVILFVLFSLSALAGFRLIERQPHLTVFGGMTIGLSVAAYFVALDAFFSSGPFAQEHGSVLTLAIVALVAGQAAMLLSFRRDDDSPAVNAVVLGSIVALALLAVLVIVEISNPGTDIGRKTFAVVSVLYLLGALLPPCLRWEQAEEA